MTVDEFFSAAEPFVASFDAWAEQYLPSASADHICFKCADQAEFERLRALFEEESAFIYQSIISKRRIAVVKFARPLSTKLGDIWYLELSDQKPDGSQASGFDHIEIYPMAGTMEALGDALEAKGMALEKVVRPHHTTIDGFIDGSFKVRLEDGLLVEKIKKEEMK